MTHEFKTHNDAEIEINGTSLVGYISATREQLEALFGAPLEGYPGDRVQVEWQIEFEDGMVATLYDWKNDQPPAKTEVYQWHIGSHQQWRGNAVARIHDMLRAHLGMKARSETA